MTENLDDTQPKSPLTTGSIPVVEEERRGGGCGCLLGGLMTAFVVTVLVIIGLFLPPIDLYNRLFGTQFTMLSSQANAASSVDNALTLTVSPEDAGQEFGVAISSVSLDQFITGNVSTEWAADARDAVPPTLALQSNVYRIEVTGGEPRQAALTVNLPGNLGSAGVLDLYSWNDETGKWRFVPSQPLNANSLTTTVNDIPGYIAVFQAAPPAPTVLASVDVTQKLSGEVGQLATIVAPAGMQPTLQGTLAGNPAPGFDVNSAYRVMPVIRNFSDPRAIDPQTVTAILSNRAVRAEHVRQITVFATNNGFDGVFIDYRDLLPEQRENFTAFISELSSSLAQSGQLLGVVVPAAINESGIWNTGAYDWRAIGNKADYVQINLENNPGVYEIGVTRPVDSMLRWSVGEISRYKLLIGLSALSVREVNAEFTPIGFDEALAALGDVTVPEGLRSGVVPPGTAIRARLDGSAGTSGIDTLVNSPFIDYQAEDGSTIARMWLTTGDALRFRMDKTLQFALGGVAFEDLLKTGVAEDVLSAILNYKLQLPAATTPVELALRWRVEGSDGTISEVITGLNEELVTTIDAPDGNYAINVSVVSAQLESSRAGTGIVVSAPTNTPTPLPTNTPTAEPTITPTLAPVIPTNTPQPITPAASGGGSFVGSTIGNPNPAPPPSGSIGAFEFGGHVTGAATTAAGTMKGAGMSWMKVQLRYHMGLNPGVAAGEINAAHAAGFKILLGVVGDPNELRAGGAGYVSDFANFLGGVAALGPDAIEVWNEPNIDREWPLGQISGTSYTVMLQQAYNAIKNINGSVLVISAAPAPTGAEGAYPGGEVMNDDRWLREVVAAGGLNYMDCMGAHYNEGIVPPGQTSGDPRDNYYTRYFYGMLNTYWSIGGGKQICFTELGYLTPEGYPPLDPYFGWASGVTLGQQAAWLAEAAAFSAQSGKVRLLIVWNIDFTSYGTDPQAGYAIIRPGGACPACSALAAAR